MSNKNIGILLVFLAVLAILLLYIPQQRKVTVRREFAIADFHRRSPPPPPQNEVHKDQGQESVNRQSSGLDTNEVTPAERNNVLGMK